MSEDTVYDVIVIGAGYAGLLAARTLFRAGKSILLLEARDRVGGRSYSVKFDDGHHADNGAAFLGPDHTKMLALAKEYGVELYPTHHEGRLIQYYRDKVKSYKGIIPRYRLWEILDMNSSLQAFEKVAATMNLEEPWKSPNAKKWDSMTYEQWLRRTCKTQACRDVMSIFSGVLWGCEPSEISMLHILWFAKAGKNLTHLGTTVDGAQETLFREGSSAIAWKVYEELGDHVRLQQPAERIIQEGDIVTVKTYTDTFKAKKVICTIPLPLIKRIRFTPPLPEVKRHIIDQHYMGNITKVHFFYKKAFWRGKYSGEVTAPHTWLQACFDVGPPDGEGGVLLGFVSGHKARIWATISPEERKKIAIKEMVTYFGEEAREPYRYHEYTMSVDEWSSGCPTHVPRPGMWTTIGHHLYEPVDHVHFAGSEYSTTWTGYMEGAVRSGEKVAGAVLELLKGTDTQ